MMKAIRRILDKPKWHNLRSLKPVSDVFGLDRGTPIDRFYIEDFLKRNSNDIKGVVLEISEDYYSRKFGSNVSKFEILHATSDNEKATIVGDLTKLNTLPERSVDCFICTQTFNFIYDFHNAITGAWHVLKDGGTLLATVSGLSPISRYDMDRWGDYWRFTTLSAKKSFEAAFGKGNVEVDYYGNVLSSVAFVEGISGEELTEDELFYKDPNFQVTIVIKAIK